MRVALAFVCNFLGLLLSAAFAQTAAVTQPALSYREEMDYIFQPLDKSKTPSGILYDRIFPLADVTDFTGTSIQDTTDSEHWFQAYYQFYQASYNTTGKLPSHQVRNAVDASYGPNILPIGIMRYKYDVLDSLAVDKNLMYVQNGQLHDVAGRTLSPYITKTIFMATPLYTSSQQYLSVGTTTLKLAPNFIFNNTGTAFTAYRVNFNDGRGELPISANGTVSINYTTPGKKFITIIAHIGTTRYYSKAELNVQGSSSVAYRVAADGICSEAPQVIPITGALPFNPSAYGDSESKAATGRAYLYFAQANCADRKLRKTVVFLDGFDPDNARDHNKIYENYINNTDERLAEKFRKDGYDLVILDYDDAGDYIERNGLLVIKLLQELKRLYGSTLQQDFVVIGPSMGALVGQYALAEAERQGIAHYTRLFISFDGPHQGANIPISLQQAVGYVFKSKIVEPSVSCSGQVSDGAEEDAFALNVRSAKQMLLHHYLSGSESPAPHPFRTTFVNTMKTLGYPKLCRKVAIINGSRKALTQTAITPTQEILRLRVVKNVGAKRGIDLLRWKAFAAPQAARSVTFDAYTWKPIAKKLGLQKTYNAYAQPASGRPSLDVIAGGYSNTMELAAEAAIEPVNVSLICLSSYPRTVPGKYALVPFSFEIANKLKKGRNIKITTGSPNHCFIPTTSAVDLQVSGSPLTYDFTSEDLACTGKTPFNAVYAPEQNQLHVQVTATNSLWFENEIKGTPAPTQANYGATIAGPDNMCASASYQLASLPNGATASWKVSPTNLFTVSTGTGTMANLQKASTSSTGQATITFTISGKCGNELISKNITLGSSNTAFISNPYDLSCYCQIYGPETGKTYQFFVDTNVSGVDPSNYLWTITPPLDSPEPYPMEYSGSSIYFDAYYPGEYTFELQQYTPGCGWSVKDTRSFYFNQGYDMYAYAYPNPTSDELNVSLSNAFPEDGNKTDSSYEVRLLDTQQKEVYSKKTKEKQLIIPVQKLKSGTYYLQLKSGNRNVVNRILIGKEVK